LRVKRYNSDMYTVKQVADFLGISTPALRNWGKEYGDYLSDLATPPKGQTRRYTEDDLLVLNTIAVLKQQGKEPSRIQHDLRVGDYIAVDLPPQEAAGHQQETALQTESFTQTIALFEERLNRWEKKIDQLQIDLRAAENRATEAETELRILKEAYAEKPAQDEKLSFWQRVFGRR